MLFQLVRFPGPIYPFSWTEISCLYTRRIGHGRHTFVSHALAGGRTLAEVRDAGGHSHVGITSLYLHVSVEDDAAVGSLFGCAPGRS